MIKKETIKQIHELEGFALWLRDEVMSENWDYHAVGMCELICRRLVKLGLLELKDGEYRYSSIPYYRPSIKIIAENRRKKYKRRSYDRQRKSQEV